MIVLKWLAIGALLTFAATVFFCVFIGPLFRAIDQDGERTR